MDNHSEARHSKLSESVKGGVAQSAHLITE